MELGLVFELGIVCGFSFTVCYTAIEEMEHDKADRIIKCVEECELPT